MSNEKEKTEMLREIVEWMKENVSMSPTGYNLYCRVRCLLAKDIEPCPFCGGPAVFNDNHGDFWGECLECYATGPGKNSKEGAIKAWNNAEM